jgi:hypothetical protein
MLTGTSEIKTGDPDGKLTATGNRHEGSWQKADVVQVMTRL